jgi:hypothetical protein
MKLWRITNIFLKTENYYSTYHKMAANQNNQVALVPVSNVPIPNAPVLPNVPIPLALQNKNVLNLHIRTFATSVALIDATMVSAPLNNDNWNLINPDVTLWIVAAIKFALQSENRVFDPVQRIILPPGFNMLEVRTPGSYDEALNTFRINTSYIRICELNAKWRVFASAFVTEMRNMFDIPVRPTAIHVLTNMLRINNNCIEFGVFIPDM